MSEAFELVFEAGEATSNEGGDSFAMLVFELHFFTMKLVAEVTTVFDEVLKFVELGIDGEGCFRSENAAVVGEELSVDFISLSK